MKLGVVCEGATDFEFIKNFLPEALRSRGVEDVEIVSIQPPTDNSRGGGCTEVINWLAGNPPAFRNAAYLGGGLFSLKDSKAGCDGLIIQMDSDVLGDESFRSFLADQEGPQLPFGIVSVAEKAEHVKSLLSHFALHDEMTEREREQHVYVAAVDATEAWCVAAYKSLDYDPESLVGEELATCFGQILNHSEGKEVVERYTAVDKSIERRAEFCGKHRQSRFLERQASQFNIMVEEVSDLLCSG